MTQRCEENPIKLIFDATILSNGQYGDSNRSGIYVVARELLLQFAADSRFSVRLFCWPWFIPALRRELAKPPFQHLTLPIVNESEASVRMEHLHHILLLGAHAARPGTMKRRFLAGALQLWKLGEVLRRSRIFRSPALRTALKDADAFFSPKDRASSEIVRSGVPLFYFVHDTIPQLFPDQFPQLKFGLCWQQNLFASLNHRTFVFTNSDQTGRDLRRFFPAQLAHRTISAPLAAAPRFRPCGAPSEIARVRAKYGIPADSPYLLSLCTIEPRKNILFSLRNFIRWQESHPDGNLLFVLAGSSRFPLGMDVNVMRHVVVTGYVDDDDLPALYSGARAMLYPSRYEGFGLPILEAMQCGCPVVSGNGSSLPEVAGDAAILVDPDDDDAMLDAITRLAAPDGESLRAKLHAAGLERAKLFSWNRTGQIIADGICGEVLRAANPRIDLFVATLGRTVQLRAFLEGIRAQTYKNIRILICDQNPPGVLDPILADFHDLNILRVHEPPLNLSYARNSILPKLDAGLMAFPDDDCVYEPDTLESFVSFFRTHPDADGAIAVWSPFDASDRDFPPRSMCRRVNRWNCFMRGETFVLFFRAEAARGLRFDEMFGLGKTTRYKASEDTDFELQFLERGRKVYRTGSIRVRHKATDFDVTDPARIRTDCISRMVLLKKHKMYAAFPAMLFFPLVRILMRPSKFRYYGTLFLDRCRGVFVPYSPHDSQDAAR